MHGIDKRILNASVSTLYKLTVMILMMILVASVGMVGIWSVVIAVHQHFIRAAWIYRYVYVIFLQITGYCSQIDAIYIFNGALGVICFPWDIFWFIEGFCSLYLFSSVKLRFTFDREGLQIYLWSWDLRGIFGLWVMEFGVFLWSGKCFRMCLPVLTLERSLIQILFI